MADMGLWSKKSIAELQISSEEEGPQLRRSLSAFDLVLFGIGTIIGAGLFSITGIAAAENAGPAIVISFLFAAVGCAFAGLCYSELSTMIPVSGSAYTYSYVVFGELIAWIIGWTLVLEYAIGAAAVAISWSAYALSLLEDFGLHFPTVIAASPWQLVKLRNGAVSEGVFNLPAVAIVVAVTIVLIIGIRESARANKIMVFIKLAATFVFIGTGIFYIDPANYVPFIPENTGTFGEYGWSGILRATGVVFFAYIGFDAISTTAQETKAPQKSLPIGILGSLTICSLLYILFAYVMTGLVNYKELDVAAPVAVAIAVTPFYWLDWIVKLVVLTGMTSVILVLLLGQSRIFYVMAKDGLLPKFFGELHPTYKTPWKSNLILLALVGLIAGFMPLSIVSHMTSIGTLLAFVIVCVGVMVLRKTKPEQPRPFTVPLYPWVPIGGILSCSLMILTLGIDSWLRLLGWLAIGLVIYFGYGRHHSHS
ncbi:MAG: amino acid permease [Parachlamydiaceae bacterium]|nr:amino acid permease [Parachlamydiaceae bacterium]